MNINTNSPDKESKYCPDQSSKLYNFIVCYEAQQRRTGRGIRTRYTVELLSWFIC